MSTIENKTLSKLKRKFGLGFLPDLASPFDYGRHEAREIYNKLNLETNKASLPVANDYSGKFTAIRNQGSLGACTAFATVTALVEFYNKNMNGTVLQASPRYQYKMTRDIMGVTGDTGAYMRSAMQALVKWGWVTEKDFPYIISKFDEEPSPDLKYGTGKDFQATKYIRVDQQNVTPTDLVTELKRHASADIPIMFGFTVFEGAWNQANSNKGAFPQPAATDKIAGGHAICIAGYDDNKIITNTQNNTSTKGAFKIRNSWSEKWGEKGYGWIPYKYVETGIALDFWVLLDIEFINEGVFK